MALSDELVEIIKFFRMHGKQGFFSTSAQVVNIHDDVYNVIGSTKDPKIGGKSWKQLLISRGIDNECYVTNQKPPSGTSHNDFSVGGHVTDVVGGNVSKGDITYLMPLCYWHNSKKRDGKNFEHSETKMLELTGFMQGDTPTTFMARMGSTDDNSPRVLFQTEEGWDFKKVDVESHIALRTSKNFQLFEDAQPNRFIVIKRNPKQIGRYVLDFTSKDLEGIF